MKKRRRIEITVETSLLVLRRKTIHSSSVVNCSQCAVAAPLVTPEEAARLAGVTVRTIYRWVEAERLHHTETAEGEVLVCPLSLVNPCCASFTGSNAESKHGENL